MKQINLSEIKTLAELKEKFGIPNDAKLITFQAEGKANRAIQNNEKVFELFQKDPSTVSYQPTSFTDANGKEQQIEVVESTSAKPITQNEPLASSTQSNSVAEPSVELEQNTPPVPGANTTAQPSGADPISSNTPPEITKKAPETSSELDFQNAYHAFMSAKPEEAAGKFINMREAYKKLPKKEGGGLEESIEFEAPSLKPIARGLSSLLGNESPSEEDIAKTKDTASLIDILTGLGEGKNDLGQDGYEKLSSLIDDKNFDEKAIQEALGLDNPISIKKEKDGTIIIEVSAEDIGKFTNQKINKDGKATPTQEKGAAEKDAAAKDAVKNDEAGTDDKKEEKSKFRDPRKAFPSYVKLGGFIMTMMIACTVFPVFLPFAAPAIVIAFAVGAVKTAVEVIGAAVDAFVAVVTGVKTVGKAVIDFGKEVKDIGGKFVDLFGAAFKAAYKGVTGKSWDEKSPGPEHKIAENMNIAKDNGQNLGSAVKTVLETAGKEADESIKKANKLQRDNLKKDLEGKGASESQIKGVLEALEKSQKDPSLANKLAFAKAQASLEKDLKEKAAVMKDLDKKGATKEQKQAVAKALEDPKEQEAAKGANKVMGELADKASIRQEAVRNMLAEGLKGRGASDKQVEAAVGALKAVHQEGSSARKEFDKTMDGINKALDADKKKATEPEKTGLLDKITAKFTSFADGVKGLFSSSKTPDTKSVEMKDMNSRLAQASRASISEPITPAKAAASEPSNPSIAQNQKASISGSVGTGSKPEPAEPKEPEAVAKPSLTRRNSEPALGSTTKSSLTRRNSEPALGSDFTEAVKNLTGKVTEPPTHSGSTSEISPSPGKANDHNITTGAGRGGVGG